ncbi:MAG: hypothetical protein ACR2RD_11010 [Woeseiaceae bacterium]
MKFVKQSIAAILCAMLVVACSGGDGGPVPPEQMPSSMAKIDAISAAPITSGVIDAVFASGTFGDVIGGGGSGGLVSKTENGSAKVVDSQSLGLIGYLNNVAEQETTTACAASGSSTVSGQVADPTTLSADDRISLVFLNCDDGAGQVLNGAYEVVINSFSGDLLQGLVNINGTVTFDRFEVTELQDTISLTGSAQLDLDTSVPLTTSISVFGDSLSISDNSDAVILTQFQTDVAHDAGVAPKAYTSAASGMMSSGLFEGAVRYSTPVPFMGFAGEYPFTGELLLIGADDASVRVLVLDSVNLRLEIDPGDGSSIVSEVTTWEEVARPVIAVTSGIRGTVIRGPINPGPEIEGVANEEPFSALFNVLDSAGNRVARFQSDENGIFEVLLPPGEYTVVPGPSAPVYFPEQQTKDVTVPADGFADVVLGFDTGIR